MKFKSKSFINIKNSNGPKTDPCGILLKTSFQIDTMPFIQTLCVRLSNQFLIQSNSLPPIIQYQDLPLLTVTSDVAPYQMLLQSPKKRHPPLLLGATRILESISSVIEWCPSGCHGFSLYYSRRLKLLQMYFNLIE